jgi:hypothetical protein
MKTKTYPINPDQFKRRADRLRNLARRSDNDYPFRIPPILSAECWLVVEAYYGGKWAAVRAMIWAALRLSCWSFFGHVRIRTCDMMGWTKLYDMTAQGFQMRHGRCCSGSPNCNNHLCIEESVPGWFKWLTRWEEL